MASLNLKAPASDPAEIIKLCSTLYDKSGIEIQKKVNRYLQNETGASVVFMVPLSSGYEEAIIQVLGEEQLPQEVRFPVTNNVLHQAIKRRCSITATSLSLDPDLQIVIRTMVTPMPKVFLTIPVSHPQTDIISLLVCLANYTESDNAEYMITQMIQDCFRFTIGIVLNSVAYEEERRLKEQCQSLLSVARNLFSHLGNMSDLLREILAEARQLTDAERCSLFLVDEDRNELVAKVFDGESSNVTNTEVRFPKDQGIAGKVATTGEFLNIRNVYNHPLFFRGVDEATGFKTRSLLCFPIRKDNKIIGVAQMCNKRTNKYFNVFDEEVAMAFSIYCGISIMHSIVYKRIQDAQARNKLSNELMMYHMKVSDEEVKKVISCQNKHNLAELNQFNFAPRSISPQESICLCWRMFDDLGFIKMFHIKKDVLIRFFLYVQRGYRDTPYHNWGHAFSIMHFAYLMLKQLKLIETGHCTNIEALAFMISCACHDLDHRGTTNSFQTISGTVLASLYSSEGSVMERHHLAQALCILNTDHCNILDKLSHTEYIKCLDLIRDMILATDLAQHFRVFKEEQRMFQVGFKKYNEKHRGLLLSLLMTCCDLSDQTKDWRLTKQIAELIYAEFFKQGDLEKAMGNKPLEMMDRDRAKIPELQIQFLSDIVIPLFNTLSAYFPAVKVLKDTSVYNVECWKAASGVFTKRWAKGDKSMDILLDNEFELEVLQVMKLEYKYPKQVFLI